MALLRKDDVPERSKAVPYPAPFAEGVGPATRRSIGDAGGLTQFGVHLETLAPGANSTHRHWHADQDEMVYVLEGRLILIDNAGERPIGPGDAVTWPAGEANGHKMRNPGPDPSTYLVIGARGPRETVTYSDIDLKMIRPEGSAGRFTRADGRPLDRKET